MNEPLHLFKGLEALTLKELEKNLSRFCPKNLFIEKAVIATVAEQIFIDLSRVRWVTLGAAAQLVLLVEYLKKNKKQVFVAFPLRRLSSRVYECKKMPEEIRNNYINQRKKANRFLRIIQFEKAVKCPYTEGYEVRITEEFDLFSKKTPFDSERFSAAFANELYVEDIQVDYTAYNYQYILPLTWLPAENVNIQLKEVEVMFKSILTNQQRGMGSLDVLSLKNVIISELLKNVREHAGKETSYGLLTIGLMPTQTLINQKKEEFTTSANDVEAEYLNWLYENNVENFIEIYFGDSGKGIVSDEFIEAYKKEHPQKEENKEDRINVLEWAFDKWSTSKTEEIRGTKGLYRIYRIVNKYNGNILIRTHELCGGYQKGGKVNAEWVQDKNELYPHPGTLIQLKLCPYKEIVKFNFSVKDNNKKRDWVFLNYNLHWDSEIEDFESWIKGQKEIKGNSNILLLIHLLEKSVSDKTKETLSLILKELCYLRHPIGYVVYFDGEIGSELIEEIAHSTNELIGKSSELKDADENIPAEAIDPEEETIYDPVVLVGNDNQAFWVGKNPMVISFLNNIYLNQRKSQSDSNESESIAEFEKLPEKQKIAIIEHFQNDNALVYLCNDKLIFNFDNIQSISRRQIKQYVNSVPKITSSICTPKLKVVQEWLNINDILRGNNSMLYAFALSLILKNKVNINPHTHIFIDHNQQKRLAEEFAKLTGIERRNIVCLLDDIDYNVPRRTPIFNRNDKVIILTTIISSSETIRRLVKYVKRDFAEPVCILCLINRRDNSIATLRTWNNETPIYSIWQENEEKTEENRKKINEEQINIIKDNISILNKCEKFVSPDYELKEKENIPASLIDDTLKQYLIRKRALHYNHIGSINGRHFTFYLNKKMILSDQSFIWDHFFMKIESWIKTNCLKKITLIKPQYPKDNDKIWDNCVDFLMDKIKNLGTDVNLQTWDIGRAKAIREVENILFLDFGILTGKSLNTFLSKVSDAKHIFVCILFSQFRNNDLDFYEKITDIKSQIRKDLFRFEESKASLQVNFLYKFPIDFYTSSTCPVCEHENALEYFKMEDSYMVQFANDRKKRLKIVDKSKTPEVPTDFYNEPDRKQELSIHLIIRMYDFKLKLEKALRVTQYRLVILNELYRIYNNLEEQQQNPDSDLYAFLYFTSYEVMWLQKEPLVFKDLRTIISNLAHRIAIIPLSELSNFFIDQGTDENLSIKYAIRYKYAAITVLRSSQKLKFCESVYDIIHSAVYLKEKKPHISNSLFQNTIYHIHSLHQNKYNRSSKYFETLEENLKKLFECKDIPFKNEQKLLLDKIRVSNLTLWKNIEITNHKTDLENIKRIKDQLKNLFKGESHPVFYEAFQSLDFRNFDAKAYDDLKINLGKSKYLQAFLYKQNSLLGMWSIVKNTMIPEVKPYLDRLSHKILQSEIFKRLNYKDNIYDFFEDSPDSISGKFSQYILKISGNINDLISYYDEYHKLYDAIYKNIICYKKNEQDSSQDSLLLHFFNQYPGNLRSTIEKLFMPEDFKQVCIHIDNIHNAVFYPSAVLEIHLKYIRYNIFSNLEEGKSLKDITLNFQTRSEDKYVILEIKNDGTKPKVEGRKGGGLSQFQKDLACFGGELEYAYEENNKCFCINIKMLRYE